MPWYLCSDNYYNHDDYFITLFLSILVKLKFLFLQYFKLLKLFPYHYCSYHLSLSLLGYNIYLALIVIILICYSLKTLYFLALINNEPFWALLWSVDIAQLALIYHNDQNVLNGEYFFKKTFALITYIFLKFLDNKLFIVNQLQKV